MHLPTKLEVGVTHSKALFSFSPFIVGPCDSVLFQIGRLRQVRQDFAQDYATPVQLTITTFPKNESFLRREDPPSPVQIIPRPFFTSRNQSGHRNFLNFGASCELHFSANWTSRITSLFLMMLQMNWSTEP